MYESFSKFGSIADIDMQRDNCVSNITYIRHSSVEALKTIESVEIGDGRLVKINSWDDCPSTDEKEDKLQPTPIPEPISIPPIDESQNILNVLNVYCLEEILRHCSPNGENLMEIAKISLQWRQLAFRYFLKKFHEKATFFKRHLVGKPIHYIEEFFQTFGKWMTVVKVNRVDHDHFYSPDIMVGIILKYCPNITALKCRITQPTTIPMARKLIDRLKHLHITLGGTNVMDLRQMIGPNAKLQTLFIKDDRCKRIILPVRSLLTLTKIGFRIRKNSPPIEFGMFFDKNPQINEIDMRSNHLATILLHARNVESLSYTCPKQSMEFISFQPLLRLRSLKLGARSLNNINIIHMLDGIVANRIPLERLSIKDIYFYDRRMMGYISSMPTLRSLRLSQIQFNRQLVQFARHLRRLDEIIVYSMWDVSDDRELMLNTAIATMKNVHLFYDVYCGKSGLDVDLGKINSTLLLGDYHAKSINIRIILGDRTYRVSEYLRQFLSWWQLVSAAIFLIFYFKLKVGLLKLR